MAVPVDIFVKDQSVVPLPLPGVLVNIYNPSTLAYLTGAVTDSNGKASFLLDGSATPGTAYEARFFKAGVQFSFVKQIAVLDPLGVGETNQFDHNGVDSSVLPLSSSPDTCRLSGTFVGLNNAPYANALVRFLAKIDEMEQFPKAFNHRMVAAEHLDAKTDINGYVSVELIRNAEYWVTFSGNTDMVWCVKVPDVSAVNLIDVIHPYPVSLAWDSLIAPGNAITIAVGETKSVPFKVTFSDYQVKSLGMSAYLTLLNSFPDAASLGMDDGAGLAILTGIAPGSTQVTVETKALVPPIHLPQYSIAFSALQVTVTL